MVARVRALSIALLSVTALTTSVWAQSYRLTVTHLDAHAFEAANSKVVIETRACGNLGLGEEPEEAILNWEGPYGDNWLLFTRTRIKCDVIAVR
jgi:hypothetical protein